MAGTFPTGTVPPSPGTSSGPPVHFGGATERHVYVPHRAGLPPLGPYLRQLWQRREFAVEYSRSEVHAQNVDTVFGQVWLVLNPLLLGAVYFILVDVLSNRAASPGYFAHLLAGLFAYYYVTGCMTQGARSVVRSGRLLINTAFPRVLLPLSSTLVAFWRFLPTLAVYAVVHLVTHRPIGLALLLAPLCVAQMTLMGAGLAMFFATAQVYFRDTSSLLPYMTRIWLYLSPVLLTVGSFPYWSRVGNPLFYIMGEWSELLVYGVVVPWHWWAMGTAWALLVFVVGGLVFVSREREFAVRL
jgi:teichoic acid transport system permease protein